MSIRYAVPCGRMASQATANNMLLGESVDHHIGG
jgi:hypothetical protein